LSGRCPRSKVGLLPDPERKGTDSFQDRRGHLPHRTLYVMVDTFYNLTSTTLVRRKTSATPRSRCLPQPQRGPHLGHLRSLLPIHQRTRFPPLRSKPPPWCLSHPARPLATQPAGAFSSCRTHRGSGLASGADTIGARRGPYEALDSAAMPVRDAERRGTGWLAAQADIGWSTTAWDGMRAFGCSWP
jgi:hypothetical protein